MSKFLISLLALDIGVSLSKVYIFAPNHPKIVDRKIKLVCIWFLKSSNQVRME